MKKTKNFKILCLTETGRIFIKRQILLFGFIPIWMKCRWDNYHMNLWFWLMCFSVIGCLGIWVLGADFDLCTFEYEKSAIGKIKNILNAEQRILEKRNMPKEEILSYVKNGKFITKEEN